MVYLLKLPWEMRYSICMDDDKRLSLEDSIVLLTVEAKLQGVQFRQPVAEFTSLAPAAADVGNT